MATGDITSLPKWAQREFGRLQMKLRDSEKANELLRQENPESRVQVGFDEMYLPENVSIYFRVGEDAADKIGVRIKNGKLDVNGYGGRISIHPQATNSAEIELHPRF